jgi:hypothetical protein
MTLRGAPAASTCLLLTDGTVICQRGEQGHDWRRLTPDAFGRYVTGTWSPIASLPPNYGPLYYASAVLPDGRVIVVGGEYNNPSGSEVNLGAVYDPTTDVWTPITGPWPNVGDSDSVVLADGRFILRHLFSKQIAQFNPATDDFTILAATGKADSNSEEGSSLLPDGTVLVVDCGTQGGTHSEKYDPATNAWSSAGSTIVSLPDNGGFGIVPEIGAQVLRPDGTAVVFGATKHNAVYDTAAGTWTPTSDYPVVNGRQMIGADAPAALLPSGNVLVATSPFFDAPTHYFEFNGSGFLAVADPPGSQGQPSYVSRMLVLPTGQVLLTNGTGIVEIYTPRGRFADAWRPVITSAPASVSPGQTYAISGQQFNGLSQASMYGDDAQAATNYPLVRIKNHATGHVCYARTHDHSSMGVATGAAIVSTWFDGPACLESGASDLVVVANGIPSTPVVINGPDHATTTNDAAAPRSR